jgi:imidazolonepropionase
MAASRTPVEISATYLGAHSVPPGKTADEATEDIINVQLPKLSALKEAGEISPENIDVFLEKGVFDAENTRKILQVTYCSISYYCCYRL